MNPERITASALLSAARNNVGLFSKLITELDANPEAEEKVVFELLAIAEKCLRSRSDPQDALLWAVRCRNSVSPARIPAYLSELESIVVRYLENLLQEVSDPRDESLLLPLAMAMGGIRELDRHRFTTLLEILRKQEPNSDRRREFLEKTIKFIPGASRES